jgi:uncharacterized protein
MIKNITTKKTIVPKKKKADCFIKRAIGLMFRFKEIDYGLIFDTKIESKERTSIHMFFVFFKINVLFLDSQKKVVDKKKELRPFQMYTPKKKARYIIELSKNINIDNINIKDKIEW